MVVIKRKLYKRGSSFETTIPMPLLFSIDVSKKHNVVFNFDDRSRRWYVELEEESREEDNVKGAVVRGKEVRGKIK